MMYNVLISDFYGSVNLWNLSSDDLSRLVEVYDLGGESYFVKGEKYDFDNINYIQIYESSLSESELKDIFNTFDRRNLFSNSIKGKYVESKTLDRLPKSTNVTSKFVKGEYGYRKEDGFESETKIFPLEIFDNTRTYLVQNAEQAIDSYQRGNYDAAMVMMRKILETLIIECFESHGMKSYIQDENGNFLHLGDLISRLRSTRIWTLSRNADAAAAAVKRLGDLSAHSRRFNTRKGDIDKVIDDIRLLFEELINIVGYPAWNKRK